MNLHRSFYWLWIIGLLVVSADSVLAKPKTGILEKKKIEGEKVKIFTDTVYGYTLTTPKYWDFKVQREKSDDELNPYRLRAIRKDKQIPTQLEDARSAVTPAQIYLFVVDLDWTPERMRDSLASPTFESEWQDPIVKQCELLRYSEYLNSMDIRWENKWRGAGFSVQHKYTAQVATGALFSSVSEVLLGEFYVFPFRGKRMIIHLVTEREFLEENRALVRELLEAIDPQKS
jgi:hypothetical protein